MTFRFILHKVLFSFLFLIGDTHSIRLSSAIAHAANKLPDYQIQAIECHQQSDYQSICFDHVSISFFYYLVDVTQKLLRLYTNRPQITEQIG